jgi:hypothetical protein
LIQRFKSLGCSSLQFGMERDFNLTFARKWKN